MQGLPLELIEAHYFESMIINQYLKVTLRLRDSKEICYLKTDLCRRFSEWCRELKIPK